jgi:hypothetical protein
MPDDLTCCAYWGPREWSVDECARRWAEFLRGLAHVDGDLFGNWFVNTADGDDYLPAAVDLGALELRDRVEAGRHERAGLVLTELGYLIKSWTGGEGALAVDFTATVGSHDPHASTNGVVLRLGKNGPGCDKSFADVLPAVVDQLVAVWQPDWAFVGTYAMRMAQRTDDIRQPIAGYLTYLSSRRAETLVAAGGYEFRRTDDGGVVVSLRKDEDVLAFRNHLKVLGLDQPTPADRDVW